MLRALLRRLGVGPRTRRKHRDFNAVDRAALRTAENVPVVDMHNPGIRVEQNIIKNVEAELMLCSDLRELARSLGFMSSEPQQVFSAAVAGAEEERRKLGDVQVTPIRVTGRDERQPADKVAPWGHGDAFDVTKVPAYLQDVERSIRARDAFALGPLRDVTINYRLGRMFKLDPHIDPEADGENVVIVGLNSDTVLTFTRGGQGLLRTPEQIARQSWHPDDIDVAFPRRAAVFFSGDARYVWKHAIRAGVLLGKPHNVICDWWGDLARLVPRSDERISVVMAFGKV
ncbi:hypothetical protein FVE85_2407 [Porphyridium purpureum]|uniref:Fe2OG dioxygenase domain-containing protein n=1 Tax=Porphyridium purpureum TaxID=35688 RepID=A0A5J4YZI4_PORPP|nr:hypothetical protein FVE85_2407 [Porphyridium purpureum]|eukprot:POR7867..scf209_3